MAYKTFNISVNRLRAVGGAFLPDDYGNSIQSAVDAAYAAGGGFVALRPGNYSITTPLQVPRPDLDGFGGVSIIGPGSRRTRLLGQAANWPNPDGTYPEGRGVIETVPNPKIPFPTPITGNHHYRAWGQYFAGFSIEHARKQSLGFLHHLDRPDVVNSQSHTEKMTMVMEDVVFRGYNDWPQVAIRIEGNAHDVTIRRCTFDCGIFDSGSLTQLYDYIGLKTDIGAGGLLDLYGVLSLIMENIALSPIKGGWTSLIRGRVVGGTIRNINAGKGSLGTPQIYLENSSCVQISNLITEGKAEVPAQVHIVNSRDVEIRTSIPGTPNVEDTPIAVQLGQGQVTGDGIKLEGSSGCRIFWDCNYTNQVRWDTRGFKRVVMDANSMHNYVKQSLTDGVEGVEAVTVVTDNGVNNEVVYSWPTTGNVHRYYNRVAVPEATRTVTGNTTITSVEKTLIVNSVPGGGITVTLPAASAVVPGSEIVVMNGDGTAGVGNVITINRAGADTISGATSTTINSTYGSRKLRSNGSNAWVLV